MDELQSTGFAQVRNSLTAPPQGSVEISAWTLGTITGEDIYVLNLRSDYLGRTFPVHVSPAALAGMMQSLGLARQYGGRVYFFESTSIIHIGWVAT